MSAATFESRTTARHHLEEFHWWDDGPFGVCWCVFDDGTDDTGVDELSWIGAGKELLAVGFVASFLVLSLQSVGKVYQCWPYLVGLQFGGCTFEEQADISFGPFRTLAAFCEFCCPSFLLDCGQRLPLGVYHCHVAVFRELHFVQRCLCPRWSCGCFTLMPMLLMSSSVMCLVGRSASTTTWSGVAWCCCRACISPIVSSSLELEASPSGIWAPAPPAGSQLNCRNVCEMCGLALTSVWLCVSVMPDLFMAISSVRQAAKVNSCAVLCTCGGRFVWATIMLMRITWRPHSLDPRGCRAWHVKFTAAGRSRRHCREKSL
eukprot:PhM_4_TR2087/c4_g1_i7/m.91436